MKTNISFALFLTFLLALSSCESSPGEGGTSTIRGLVTIREYNGDFTIPRGEYPAYREDVYIIYGNDYVYGDNFETGKDGQYEFKYLQEGTYTIYAYSKDSTNLLTGEEIIVSRVVEITDEDQVVEVPEIIILK